MATDCFLPSHLSYDDLSTCVVEEVADVAITMEAGEVKGEATQVGRKKKVGRHPLLLLL